eukprot:1004070-Ditylum_brightwellii.AAC.1
MVIGYLLLGILDDDDVPDIPDNIPDDDDILDDIPDGIPEISDDIDNDIPDNDIPDDDIPEIPDK